MAIGKKNRSGEQTFEVGGRYDTASQFEALKKYVRGMGGTLTASARNALPFESPDGPAVFRELTLEFHPGGDILLGRYHSEWDETGVDRFVVLDDNHSLWLPWALPFFGAMVEGTSMTITPPSGEPDLNLVPNRIVIDAFETAAVRHGGSFELDEPLLISGDQQEDMFGEAYGGYSIYGTKITAPVLKDADGFECFLVSGRRDVWKQGENASFGYGVNDLVESTPWKGWVHASVIVGSYRRMSPERKLAFLKEYTDFDLSKLLTASARGELFEKPLSEMSEKERHIDAIHKLYEFAEKGDVPVTGSLANDFCGPATWSRTYNLNGLEPALPAVQGYPEVLGIGYLDFKDCTNAYVRMRNGEAFSIHELSSDSLRAVGRTAMEHLRLLSRAHAKSVKKEAPLGRSVREAPRKRGPKL